MTAALSLPVRPAEGEDVWCACALCGLPYDDTTGRHGKPVEHLVRIYLTGATTWKGLHEKCWALNREKPFTDEVLAHIERDLPEWDATLRMVAAQDGAGYGTGSLNAAQLACVRMTLERLMLAVPYLLAAVRGRDEALKAANALIGEAADEAMRLQDQNDEMARR